MRMVRLEYDLFGPHLKRCTPIVSSGEARIHGYWHSHPSGDATPSATDAAMAQPDGKLWLIVAGKAATLWRASEGG